MLPECQFLVLVPELTPETRGMIGAKELAALPKGAIVVNTGRGQVLDFDALNDALENDQLFAAAIDAYFPEPLPTGHPLLQNPKVTLSPHIAGTTQSNIPWKRFLTGGDRAAQKPASAQDSSLRSAVSAFMVRMSRK
jgi:D-3-phosphoglycerate dehydrogenase